MLNKYSCGSKNITKTPSTDILENTVNTIDAIKAKGAKTNSDKIILVFKFWLKI